MLSYHLLLVSNPNWKAMILMSRLRYKRLTIAVFDDMDDDLLFDQMNSPCGASPNSTKCVSLNQLLTQSIFSISSVKASFICLFLSVHLPAATSELFIIDHSLFDHNPLAPNVMPISPIHHQKTVANFTTRSWVENQLQLCHINLFMIKQINIHTSRINSSISVNNSII